MAESSGPDVPTAGGPAVRVDELRTSRLHLHRWGARERDALAALNAEPEVMRYFPAVQDRARTDALLDRVEAGFETRGWGLWAVDVVAEQRCIGFVGLLAMPDGVPGAGGVEVGWRLARDAWGHGYATEAATAVLDVAFSTFALPEVWSMTAVANTPSQAVMRRLGMRVAARWEQPGLEPGHPLRPAITHRITAGEWAEAREGGSRRGVVPGEGGGRVRP